MAFKVKSAPSEIRIPMEVNTFDDDTKSENVEKVVHIFNFPSTSIREKHQSKLVTIKGRKIKNEGTSDAHWWLWLNCIKRVEGYDGEDGKPLMCDNEGAWRFIFDTDVLRIHVEGAVGQLLEYIGTIEGETEKN
jgi:hypothetical protein